MAQSLSGSRYELHVTRKGAAETKSQDYYTIHAGDMEEAEHAGDDIVGHVHSWEVGSTVDGPGCPAPVPTLMVAEGPDRGQGLPYRHLSIWYASGTSDA